jgi:hypothetical protein
MNPHGTRTCHAQQWPTPPSISVCDHGGKKRWHLENERKEICRGPGGARGKGIDRGSPGMGTVQGSMVTNYMLPEKVKREVSGLWVEQEVQHHWNGLRGMLHSPGIHPTA